MGVLDALLPSAREFDREAIEAKAEGIYAKTDLSSHESVVLAGMIEGADKGDIAWLIGRATSTVDRHRRTIRERASERPNGPVAGLLE